MHFNTLELLNIVTKNNFTVVFFYDIILNGILYRELGEYSMKKIKTFMYITILYLLKANYVLAAQKPTGNANDCSGVLAGLKPDLDNIFKAMKIIGPIIVFALTVYEYAMAIFSKDAEGLKKCNSRLTTRLILIAILVFLPTLINLLLGLLDPSYETCVVG